MYKHFIAIVLCGLTTTSWASNTCSSRMSDGVALPTAVSSCKPQLALLSRKGDVWSSLLDAQRRRGRTWTRIVTGERMMTNNQRLYADYRQTQIMTGECKMANGLLLHANYRQTQMMMGERMRTNGLSVQGAGATSLHPFVPTTIVGGDFAEGTRWYTLKFKNTTLAVAAADGSISEVPATAGNVDRTMPQQLDNQLWCFVGNEQEGYTLYNKAFGTTKALVAVAPATNTAEATMEPLEGNTKCAKWWFSASSNLSSAFTDPVYMQLRDANGYALNLSGQSGQICFWTGGKDNGSTVLIEPAFATVLEARVLDPDNATFYRQDRKTKGQAWNTYLISNAGDPVVTLANANGKNNIGYSSATSPKTIIISSKNSQNYTLSVEKGYVITGYSFSFKGETASTTVKDVTTAKTETATNTAAKSFSVDGIALQSVPFQVLTDAAHIQQLTIQIAPAVGEVLKKQIADNEKYQTAIVFDNTKSPFGYRIPALGQDGNGRLFVAVDLRRTGSDIGMGNGHNDIVMKTSSDHGATWDANYRTIAAGDAQQDHSSKQWTYSFGDPSIVVDRNNPQNILVMCVGGHTSFFDSRYEQPQHVVRLHSSDGGETWTKDSLTYQIYNLTKNSLGGKTNGLFLTSGKIMQSRYVKQGAYNRLYIAYPTNNTKQNATFVIFSDDFGATWKLLGGPMQLPSTGADESKVEELPDGSVLVSVRNRGSSSRGYSLFTYTDIAKGEGRWEFQTNAEAMNNAVNAVNGEILIVPARRVSDGRKLFVALQSITHSTARERVGVYFKELANYESYATATALAADWHKGKQVSQIGSCYTGMELLSNDKIGYVYEEEATGGIGGYNIIFKQIPLEDLTNGRYVIDHTVDRGPYIQQAAEMLRSRVHTYRVANGKYVGMPVAAGLTGVEASLDGVGAALATAATGGEETAYFHAQEAMAAAQKQLLSGVTRVKIERGRWYRLTNNLKRNVVLTTDGTQLKQGSVSTPLTDPSVLFQFIETTEGYWTIKNAKHKVFAKATLRTNTPLLVTDNKADAGQYTIVSTIDGRSYLQSMDPAQAAYPAIHADNNGNIVAWTTISDASQWFIEPTDYHETDDAIRLAPVLSTAPHAIYNLHGQRLSPHSLQHRGVYIVDGKKVVY